MKKAEADERIKYLATHDGLTNLPNRAMFKSIAAVLDRSGAALRSQIPGPVH